MSARGRAFDLAGRRVWVAGHRGLVGAALCRRLAAEPCVLIAAGRDSLDLRQPAAVDAFLAEARPEVVILAAATVGGIHANATRPGDFIYDNLAIQTAVIEAARRHGVARLLLLGSSCIYPREAGDPIPESALMTGPLEPTNAPYAMAKLAGIELGRAYRRQYGLDVIAALPCNLYGPGDSFHPTDSHVIAGLMRRMHAAKLAGAESVTVWGSGRPRREVLFVDDAAEALVQLLIHHNDETPVNVGSGRDLTIAELAEAIRAVVGFRGDLVFDSTKPDGTPRKRLDTTRLAALGWRPRVELHEGLRRTYAWFRSLAEDAGSSHGTRATGINAPSAPRLTRTP